MLPTLATLFDGYRRGAPVQARIDWALRHPRLLATRTVRELHARITTFAPVDGVDPMDWLGELDQLRDRYARDLSLYPIGPGPLESMLEPDVRPLELLARCRSPEVQAIIAPLYLCALSTRGADLAQGGDWPRGTWLARLAAESALAWAPDEPIAPEMVRVLTDHLAAATSALIHALDGTVFVQALAVSRVMIARAEQRSDRGALGALCHALGVLHSDMWIVPGLRDDRTPVSVEDWLARPRTTTGLFDGLGEPGVVPNTAECLRAAVGWYQRALPHRDGMHKGLTHKAIAQTLDFMGLVLHEPIDEGLLAHGLVMAAELLQKHPQREAHLATLASIAQRRGLTSLAPAPLSGPDKAIIDAIHAHTEAGDPSDETTERRRHSHAEALADLTRVLRHQLPFALYLRNFRHANERHTIDVPFSAPAGEGGVRIVVPEVSYSMVDNKILELFGEGVVQVCDPQLSSGHRWTLIPMLSLTNEGWLEVVSRLIARCHRVVMLLDELTPGVQAELDMLQALGASARTLVVTGQSYRAGEAELPPLVPARFPHVVDWIDFGHDERHHDIQHKAHVVIQSHLRRYVRADARPVVSAWQRVE